MPASVSIPFITIAQARILACQQCVVSVRQGVLPSVVEPPTHVVHGDFCGEQLEERLRASFLLLSFAVGTCPDLEPLVRSFFQDMKLGQQTR